LSLQRERLAQKEFAALGVSKYYTKDYQGAILTHKSADGNSKDNEVLIARGGSFFRIEGI
jgi:hypothetical protein